MIQAGGLTTGGGGGAAGITDFGGGIFLLTEKVNVALSISYNICIHRNETYSFLNYSYEHFSITKTNYTVCKAFLLEDIRRRHM